MELVFELWNSLLPCTPSLLKIDGDKTVAPIAKVTVFKKSCTHVSGIRDSTQKDISVSPTKTYWGENSFLPRFCPPIVIVQIRGILL